jgi:hypothetical protein
MRDCGCAWFYLPALLRCASCHASHSFGAQNLMCARGLRGHPKTDLRTCATPRRSPAQRLFTPSPGPHVVGNVAVLTRASWAR